MNFQNNLTEFNFNLETLDLLKNEKLAESEIVDTLIEAGFDSELTTLLLNLNRTYLNGVLVRLKLYNKLNKNQNQVMNSLKNYQNLKPLVQKLFSNDDNLSVEEINTINNLNNDMNNSDKKLPKDEEKDVKDEVKNNVEEDVEKDVQEDAQEDAQEDVNSSDEDNFYENFFMECLESTDNKKDTVKSKEVYASFKKWYSKNYSNEDIPSKTELKNFLNEKLGKSVKSSWSSVKLSV